MHLFSHQGLLRYLVDGPQLSLVTYGGKVVAVAPKIPFKHPRLLADLNAAMERCSGFAAWGWPPVVVVFGRNGVTNFAAFL
jgi:hypothetical protein